MESKGLRVQLASLSLGLGLCDAVPCSRCALESSSLHRKPSKALVHHIADFIFNA